MKLAAATALTFAFAATAAAQMPAAQPDSAGSGSVEWLEHQHMSADLLSRRDTLTARGVELLVTSVTDASAGVGRGHAAATSLRALITASAEADLEAVVGWRGARALLQLQTRPGRYREALVGERQGHSNIDAPAYTRVAEAWLEQGLGALRLKAGRIDLSTELAHTAPADEFLNPSFAVSPTQAGFPTFPDPRPGVVAELASGGRALRLAGFAAAGERADFGYAELELRRGRWRGAGGGWVRRASDHAPSRGLQLVADHTARFSSGRSIASFIRVGRAARGHGAVGHHALGVVSNAVGRAADLAGVALTHGRFLEEGRSMHEVTLELFYAYRAGGWLELRPDVQLVRGSGHDAAIAAVRISICH
jgi:carbohydrate-selective porin OprB